MGCLKCGKKTAEEQSFCPACLETMDAYPVKPDVHIQLPNRVVSPAPRKAQRKRRAMSAEEQAAILRKRTRQLTALAVVLLLLLAMSATLLLQSWIAAGGSAIPAAGLFHVKQFG